MRTVDEQLVAQRGSEADVMAEVDLVNATEVDESEVVAVIPVAVEVSLSTCPLGHLVSRECPAQGEPRPELAGNTEVRDISG